MNLLLLLSALLTALTGVGGSVRAPGAAQSVTAVSIAPRAAPATRRIATMRPLALMPGLADVAVAVAIGAPALVVAAVPLWANRRRE